MTVVRNRGDAYRAWDKRSVIIREQAVGSTIVYPLLPRGVTYRSYSVRDDYVLASLSSLREGILYCNHHFYEWSAMGHPELLCPLTKG